MANVSDAEETEITDRAIRSQSGDKIVILPFDDPALLFQFTELHREVVFRYLLKRLQIAIRNNMPNIVVFQFANSKRVARITDVEYKNQLQIMMDWFAQAEDYDAAINCRDLIRKIKPTDAVDQS